MPFLRVANVDQDTSTTITADSVVTAVPYRYEIVSGAPTGYGQPGGIKVTQYGLQIFYLE